jgi:hypothetical protein
MLNFIIKFTEIYWLFTNPTKISENPEKCLTAWGGDTQWTKISEKPNYYVRENPEEISAL